MEEIRRKIEKLRQGGFFHILFGNTLTQAIAFVSSIVIIRLVSKEDYAYLAYSDNLYSYINLVTGLGMSTAILKFCSSAKSKEEDKAYLRFALKYGSIFQLLISIVLLLYVSCTTLPFPKARPIVILSILYPLLVYIMTTIQNYLRAHLENALYVKMSIVQAIIVFLGSVILVLICNIQGIVWARYLGVLIAILIGANYAKNKTRGVQVAVLTRTQVKSFMIMSISLMIASFFSQILASNELLLVNHLISSEVTTANYKIGNLIPTLLVLISNSIVVYLFPIIAKTEDPDVTWNKTKKVGMLTFLLIGGLVVVGAVLSPLIISIVYGNKYQDAVGILRVFWIVHGINAGLRILPMNMLPAIGVTKFNAVLSICTCGIHIILDYIFISTLGIWGAGAASGFVYLVSGILYWWYLHRVCKKKGNWLWQ